MFFFIMSFTISKYCFIIKGIIFPIYNYVVFFLRCFKDREVRIGIVSLFFGIYEYLLIFCCYYYSFVCSMYAYYYYVSICVHSIVC